MEKSVSPERALELVLQHVPAPGRSACPVEQALGRVLAEQVLAPVDYPAFDRAMMDGFAVRATDAGTSVIVAGEASAGHATRSVVEPGRCVEIMTGAPCPAGTEAVVPVETTTREGDRVRLPDGIRPGRHVQTRGQICTQGARILEPSTLITPLALGVLVSFGRSEVSVYDRPRVGVISTGDELVEGAADPRLGQIRDSNGPMLAALAREAGVADVRRLHALDTQQSLDQTLAAVRDCEVVVLTGGVSMGRYDLVPRMVQATGAEPVFHKVTQQPGKPLFVAAGPGRLIFGLPGNSRSTHFCFVRYVAPALRRWMGRQASVGSWRGRLTEPYRCKSDRTLFVPMRADPGPDGTMQVSPFDERGSADIYNIARANVYARFEPGEHALETGDEVTFAWMNEGHG